MDVCEAAVEFWLTPCSGRSPPLHIKGRTMTPTSVVKQHDIIHYYLIVWQRRAARGGGATHKRADNAQSLELRTTNGAR